MASRNSSEVVYIGDLSRHWIISKGTQIPKGIGWYKLKPATKPTVVVQSNLFKLQKKIPAPPSPHSRFRHFFCSNLYGSTPRGPRGVKKSDFFFSQMKLLSFCANIASKRHKLQKTIRTVFLDIFKYSSIWGQY